MKIVYMGTPDFAVAPLNALVEAGHDVCLVVSKADRPKDRGKKMQSCPVKLRAEELGLLVSTPEKVKNNTEFVDMLKELAPDFIVVAAYGKILPPEVLNIPKYGCINIHGSLLPKFRGPAPIHRAVIDGEEETGITIMYMAEGMDTGDMISKVSTKVEKKTTEQLHEELSKLGAAELVKQLPLIANGTANREKQDDSLASYAPMVFKEDGVIDFSKTSKQICCLVRGFNSWPCASTILGGAVMKVYEAEEGKTSESGKPYGTVLAADKKGIEVSCYGGTVILTKIQMPGKKAMDVSAYLLGNKIEIGTVLG